MQVSLYICGMSRAFSFSLLLIFLFQLSFRGMLFTNYLANKTLITAKYCENKSKPTLKCNGSCYLKKQLDKEEKQENNPGTHIKEKQETLFNNKEGNLINSPTTIITEHLFIAIQNNYHYNTTSSIFHPPC